MPVSDSKYARCCKIILTCILFYVNMRVTHVKVQLVFVNLPVNHILSQNTAFEHIKVISDRDIIRSHIYIMSLHLNIHVHILHFDIIYLHVYINKSHVGRMKSHPNISMLYLACMRYDCHHRCK